MLLAPMVLPHLLWLENKGIHSTPHPLISKLLKLDMPAGDGVLLEGLLK